MDLIKFVNDLSVEEMQDLERALRARHENPFTIAETSLLQDGRLLDAVKLVRERTGMGLVDCKAACLRNPYYRAPSTEGVVLSPCGHSGTNPVTPISPIKITVLDKVFEPVDEVVAKVYHVDYVEALRGFTLNANELQLRLQGNTIMAIKCARERFARMCGKPLGLKDARDLVRKSPTLKLEDEEIELLGCGNLDDAAIHVAKRTGWTLRDALYFCRYQPQYMAQPIGPNDDDDEDDE